MNVMHLSMACLVAAGVVGLVRIVVHPDRSLANRVSHFIHAPVSHLGGEVTGSARLTQQPKLGAIAGLGRQLSRRPSRALSMLVDAQGDEGIRILLRHSGHHDLDVNDYRATQLRRAGSGAVVGAAVGAMLGQSRGALVPLALFGLLAGAVIGAVMYRNRLALEAKQRTEMIGLEVYSVALILAMLARAGHGPLGATRRIVGRADGPLSNELQRVLVAVASGARADVAFARAANEIAHPGAARLMRLIGQNASTGGDFAPTLKALSEQLRNDRRTELEQSATKKRSAMVLPTIVLMVPVVLLYLIAPIPSVVFGNG